MTQKAVTLYKLIVLYMLNRVNFPLTRTHISDFILEKEYTSFLTLQQVMNELIDAGMILPKTYGNRTHLFITEEGKSSLSFFENRISPAIKKDIKEYFNQKSMELRNEISITSDYYKTTQNDYAAHLCAMEKGLPLVDITLNVPLEETAIAVCDNWQKRNQEIYQNLIKELF